MNSDLVASDFVPAKEEGNTVPLCRAKPSPSFINLQASSPPVTLLKILPTKLPSGKEGGRVDFPNRLSSREGFLDKVAGGFFYWFWCWLLGPGTFRFFAGSLLIIQFCWFHFLPDFTSSFVCLFCLLMPLLDWKDWNKTFIACLVMLVKKWLGKEIVTISSVSLHFSYSSSHRKISKFSIPVGSQTEHSVQFSSVQLLSRVRLFVTPWIAARQASLSITNSQSSLKLMSIESVMPSSHLILCPPLLLLPPIRLSIRVFSNESTLCMRWPKYWSFSFSISPSNEHPGLIS